MLRIAFSTNFCPHYRVKTFELLANYHEFDFFFFSEGSEWYWQRKNGTRTGNFRHVYLPGFDVGGTRISLSLPLMLWQGNYDVYIKCIDGRFAVLAAFVVSRLRRKPFILWTGIWMRLQTIFHRFLFPFIRHIYRNADAIVVYGEHVRQYLITEGVPAQRIFVAAHAVDNDAYNRDVTDEEKKSLREKLNIGSEKRIILYLGRLEAAKGLHFLLEAFSEIHDSETILLLVGEGSYRPEIERLAQQEDILADVRFSGYIPPDETPAYYALASVLVLPSITTRTFKEPGGLVVNEAFNQAVPVIVTEAVGAAAGGLVQDGYNGFIVKERDAPALAVALQKILKSPGLGVKLGKNALDTISRWDNELMLVGFRQAIDYVQKIRA